MKCCSDRVRGTQTAVWSVTTSHPPTAHSSAVRRNAANKPLETVSTFFLCLFNFVFEGFGAESNSHSQCVLCAACGCWGVGRLCAGMAFPSFSLPFSAIFWMFVPEFSGCDRRRGCRGAPAHPPPPPQPRKPANCRTHGYVPSCPRVFAGFRAVFGRFWV